MEGSQGSQAPCLKSARSAVHFYEPEPFAFTSSNLTFKGATVSCLHLAATSHLAAAASFQTLASICNRSPAVQPLHNHSLQLQLHFAASCCTIAQHLHSLASAAAQPSATAELLAYPCRSQKPASRHRLLFFCVHRRLLKGIIHFYVSDSAFIFFVSACEHHSCAA